MAISIDSAKCNECGHCIEVCPQGAIRLSDDRARRKEVSDMPYGYGFGFRGTSPSWPYLGRGRGGLPRCWHPDVCNAPAYWAGGVAYPPYAAPWATTAPEASRERELQFLRQESAAAKEALDNMEARIRELESEET